MSRLLFALLIWIGAAGLLFGCGGSEPDGQRMSEDSAAAPSDAQPDPADTAQAESATTTESATPDEPTPQANEPPSSERSDDRPQPASDAAFEADLERVDELAGQADFVEAFNVARELRSKYRAHPRRAEVDALLSQMKEARRISVDMPYTLRQLGSEDTEATLVARRKLVNAGDVAAIFLRNAVRDAEPAVAVEAAKLLGDMRDAQAGPLFATKLATGAEEPLRSAMIDALSQVAPEPNASVLRPLYQRVARDVDHQRRDLAGYIIEATAKQAGDEPAAWAELLGDPDAYQKLRTYAQAAQQSGEPELTAWAGQYAALLGLYQEGLKAEYFHGTEFEEKVGSRLVPHISIDESDDPIPGMRKENISARWTGYLHVTEPGEYTIFASSDDGVRVFIDNKPVIQSWTMRGEEEDSAKLTLEAGLHALEVEWMQGSSDYACHLRWAGPGIEKQIVPKQHLRTSPWPGMDDDLDD